MTLNIVMAENFVAVGQVTLSRGDVTVLRKGNNEPFFLLAGDIIYEDDLIKTDKRSVLKIRFIKNGRLVLGEKSKIKIEKFQNNRPGLIKLLKGQLRSQVKKERDKNLNSKEKFLIKTRTAALGVRGTDFEFHYDLINKRSTLAVHKGLVAIGPYFEETDNRDLLLAHLAYGKEVTEVSSGRGVSIDEKGLSHFKIEKLKLLKEISEENKRIFPLKIRDHSYGNIAAAMRNAKINLRGALENAY